MKRLTLEEVDAARRHPNVQAALWAIRYGEGTQAEDGWRILFGGGRFAGKDNKPDTFDDFADHPRRPVTRSGYTSTAAGAFQFLAKTWDMVRGWHSWLTDFSPVNQERGAVALIHHRGALEDVIAGRVMDWVAKLGKEWASLPGSPYGQPTVDIKEVVREYRAAGGRFEDEGHLPLEPAPTTVPEPTQAPAPAPEPDRFQHDETGRTTSAPDPGPGWSPIPEVVTNEVGDPQPTPEPKRSSVMAAWIPYVLPHLIGLVPQLARMFSSGSATSQRNIAAAEVVVNMAKDAIGARNEQELVERIQAEPEAAATVKDTIEKNYFRLEEVGGGVAAARAFSLQAAGATGAPGDQNRTIPLSAQPTFILSTILLALVFFVVSMVLLPWELWTKDGTQIYSDEIRLVVVTAIVSGVLAALTGFWLGSSFGSQKKDDRQRSYDTAGL